MILYGTGDPIDALGTLAMHVVSVHCKDSDWPAKGVAGALGEEKPLGQGSVGMERFIGKLKAIGFKGPLNIEREVPDPVQRLSDIAMGVKLLEKLRGSSVGPQRFMNQWGQPFGAAAALPRGVITTLGRGFHAA